MISRSMNMCSVMLRPCLKPACSSLNMLSTASCSLAIIAQPMTCAGTVSNIMPRQLPHSVKFPFLDSFTISPQFRSSGMTSTSHTVRNRSCRTHAVVSVSAFSSSGIMVSIPAALPFFTFFSAAFISCLVIHSSLTFVLLLNSDGCLQFGSPDRAGSGLC